MHAHSGATIGVGDTQTGRYWPGGAESLPDDPRRRARGYSFLIPSQSPPSVDPGAITLTRIFCGASLSANVLEWLMSAAFAAE